MSMEEEQQPETSETNSQQPTKMDTPLPWSQLIPLLMVSLSESINFDLILPFLYQMVKGFEIAKDPKDISFYASLLFASFSFCQLMTIMHWGRLSDRIGRRPVMLAGMTGNLISSIFLGISPSFWAALFARSFNGLMAGNIVVVKSVIAEISDDSNRPKAMGLLPLVWNIGMLVGTSIGGMLSAPAIQYPNLFGNTVFVKYPYLLPCLVGSATTVFGLFSTMLKFKETLVKRSSSPVEPNEDTSLLSKPQQQRQKSLKELLTPTVTKVLLTNIPACLSMTMYDQVYPIFAATPTIDGGLGFDSRSIGYSMAVAGIAVFYLQLVLYPKWERRYGSLICYQYGQKITIFYVLTMPFLSMLASRAQNQHSSGNMEFIMLWVLLVISLLIRITGQVLTLTSMNLVTANIAPSRSDFGAINGMQQLTFSSMKITGSLISGTLWSWSLKHNLPYPFNYHLAWVSCAVVSSLSLFMTYRLPESVNKFLADMEG